MVQFAQLFPEEGIVVALSRQLSWSYFSALLPLSRSLQREFYAEMARMGIILCAGKNTEVIELLELSSAGIHVKQKRGGRSIDTA